MNIEEARFTGRMDFSDALRALRAGGMVARAAWGGVASIHMANGHVDKGPEPFLTMLPFFVYIEGVNMAAWLPGTVDLLADDWELCDASS